MFFLVESPYYLVEKEQNVDKALTCMKQIALINKVNLGTLLEAENKLRSALKAIEEVNHQNHD